MHAGSFGPDRHVHPPHGEYASQVQEGWKPIRLGERLLVKFTWHGETDVKPFLEATPGLQLMTLEGPFFPLC